MGKIIGRIGNYSEKQIDKLIYSLKQVIVRTVEKKLLLKVTANDGLEPPVPYIQVMELINKLRFNMNPKQSVSVITFNYDIALDYVVEKHGYKIYYGFGDYPNTFDDGTLPLYKLHGSINWAYCKKCKNIVPSMLIDYSQYVYNNAKRIGYRYTDLPIGTVVKERVHTTCKKNVGTFDPLPVIVPPTWYKSNYYKMLSAVWKQAGKELSEAEYIFIIGYSLPPTDAFFRDLYAIGSVGKAVLKKFWVFNVDTSDEIKNRYKKMLGFSVLLPEHEPRFKYFEENFTKAIDTIKNSMVNKT